MPSWPLTRLRGARLGQLRAQMAAEDEDMVQFDKDDPDFLPRSDTNGDTPNLQEYHSDLRLLSADHGLSNSNKSAIYRVRKFFDSLHRADSASLVRERSPVPPDRRSVLLRRCLHRQRLQHSRSTPGRASATSAAGVKPADSPWPSPARGRRPPPLRDVHSTPDVCSGEGGLSAASSLTNVSTISSSYAGDELDLEDWEDEPQEEEHYPDQDWLSCDRAAVQLTVETRNSSAASSFRSGIHFTARPATPSSGRRSQLSSSVGSCGIQFTAPCRDSMEAEEQQGTLTEEYGKMLTLEELRDYNTTCLTCGVSWKDEEAGLDCNECGGFPMSRPCPQCSGKCGATWDRDLTKSHDTAMAAWTGVCLFQPQKGLCQHVSEGAPPPS